MRGRIPDRGGGSEAFHVQGTRRQGPEEGDKVLAQMPGEEEARRMPPRLERDVVRLLQGEHEGAAPLRGACEA